MVDPILIQDLPDEALGISDDDQFALGVGATGLKRLKFSTFRTALLSSVVTAVNAIVATAQGWATAAAASASSAASAAASAAATAVAAVQTAIGASVTAAATSATNAATSAAAAAATYQHLPNGSLGSLSVAFDLDPDTGWYRPAADTVALVTGGAERWRVTSAGRVGVGLTDPDTALHVATSGVAGQITLGGKTANANKDHWLFGTSYAGAGGLVTYLYGSHTSVGNVLSHGGGTGAGSSPVTQQDFYTGSIGGSAVGTLRMRIDSSGNIGIGTTPGSEKVTVAGSILLSSGYTLYGNSNGGNYSKIELYNASTGDMTLGTYYASAVMKFVTNSIERVRIDASGNLFIGATSGAGRVTVDAGGSGVMAEFKSSHASGGYMTGFNGATAVWDMGTALQAIGSGLATDFGIRVRSGSFNVRTGSGVALSVDTGGDLIIGDTVSTSGINLVRSGATSAEVKLKQTGGSGRDFRIASTGSGYGSAGNLIVYDATAGAERLRLDSSGSVGIGASSMGAGGRVLVSLPVTGATTAFHVKSQGTVQSDVTSQAYGIYSRLDLAAGSYTTNHVRLFGADGGNIGAGAAINNLYAYHVDTGITNGANNYGVYIGNIGGAAATAGKAMYAFQGNVAAASAGGAAWNVHMAGTAPNYMAGGLSVGSAVDAGAGNIRASGVIKSGSYTVATLPSASAVGAGSRAVVTDSDSTTFMNTVAGGGANIVPVVSDGTNWKIG